MPKTLAAARKNGRPQTKVYSLHILSRQLEMLENVRGNLGISVSEQIRRGVDLWLKQQEQSR